VTDDPRLDWLDPVTRRQVLRGALGGGVALAAGGLLSSCGGDDEGNGGGGGGTSPATGTGADAQLRMGGRLRVGATGGGASDTIDAHRPTVDTDIMRCWNMYESLAVRTPDFSELQMLLAESIEPGRTTATWTIRLKPDLTFHNGKPVTADDVIFSLRRITDPDDPKVGAASIGYIDRQGLRKLDDRTVRVPLEFANSGFPDDIGQYFNAIVPTDYDPDNPVGTGPFKYQSFTAGQQSTFTKFADYWESGKPYVDELTIIDFPEADARVNALLGGQADAIDNLPAAQIQNVRSNPGLAVLISETGAWQPFTMRVDVAPFDDVRVRQAFRLIVDRQQMVDQVLSGQGRIANDLYAPYDPAYASDLPQRQQDLEQARSLLRQAGREDLTVELVTAPVFQGIVEAAQVFAEQAKGAGVNVRLRRVDSGTFYGDNYLKWPFAQDFWATRMYLTQVAQGDLPDSPFNETHWRHPRFIRLIQQARAEVDEARRREILIEAQTIQYEEGGYIIQYFSNIIDAHSAKLGGFVEAKCGFPFGNYWFKNIGFLANA
jgi:peptide/nickel transport system substrate-binding protein